MHLPKALQNGLIGATAVLFVGSRFIPGSDESGPVLSAAVAMVSGPSDASAAVPAPVNEEVLESTRSALDAFAVHFQRDGHTAAAEKRALQVQLVEPPEQTQILRALRPRPVIVGRARHAEQFALLLNTQVPILWIDPSAAVFNR